MPPKPLAAPSWQTEDFDIPEYLRLLGVSPAVPDYALLDELHRAHVATIPFSNVQVLLGEHPGVHPAVVQDQLVRRRRGGYCFEHAQLFAAALESLGFQVRRVLGRVRSLGSARTHMAVLVDADGTRFLCDPGFGYSVAGPVRLAEEAVREDLGRAFTVTRIEDEGWPMWALMRSGSMEHAFDEATVHPQDVRMGHLKTSADPESVFLNHLMVMRHTPEGHLTVTEDGMTVRAPGEPTEHVDLSVAQTVERVRSLGVTLTDAEAERLERVVQRLRG